MTFQIGDQIVHRNYGPGKITGIEEKRLGNKSREYYVVETTQVTLWVPLDATENSIRPPVSAAAFRELLTQHLGTGQRLPDHHLERQDVLAQRFKRRGLMDICEIVRDLTFRSRSHTLNKNDNDMMRRAQDLILNEWELAFGISRVTARQELDTLLEAIPSTVGSQ